MSHDHDHDHAAATGFPWGLLLALISSVTAYLTGAAGARILGSKVASVFGLLEVVAAVRRPS